jgi:transposase
MTITDVAGYLGLDWRTVKKVHKQHLRESMSSKPPPDPRILIVDEIAIRKGHRYLTIVADWERGTVLWVGKDRGYESLKGFFDSLSEEQRNSIEAVALDMWDPYIKAVRASCPQANIVFDQFHMVSAFGRVIDKVRNAEYRKASQEDKQVIKGSRYLLLKNKPNLSKEEKPRLEALLNLNQTLTTVYIFKDLLKRLWQYTYPAYAQRAIEQLSVLAHESAIGPLKAFVKTIKRYAHGIINHCKFPIHTSRIDAMLMVLLTIVNSLSIRVA